MKLRLLTRLVKVAAGVIASKRLLDTASTGPSIKPGDPIGPRLLQGPYRSAEVQTPPTCTECKEIVVPWCRICGQQIEIGERVFCPKETFTMDDAAMRAAWGAEIVGASPRAAHALYEIAVPKEHVHRQCAFVHTTQLFTRAITDLTKD